jgi:outer membrane biosynthesis protein TonB
MDQTEILHTIYALRVALSSVFAAMPLEQRTKATAYMSQHSVRIEESRDLGVAGTQQLLEVMNQQFDAIHKAASIEMLYLQPQPLKKPRKKPTKTAKPKPKTTAKEPARPKPKPTAAKPKPTAAAKPKPKAKK